MRKSFLDKICDFAEENLKLDHDKTFIAEVLDNTNSEVEELQDTRNFVTHKTIFGSYRFALFKAEDTTLLVLQLQAKEEVANWVLDGEFTTLADIIMDS